MVDIPCRLESPPAGKDSSGLKIGFPMSESRKHIVAGGLLIIFVGFFFGAEKASGQMTDSTRIFMGSDGSSDSLNLDTTKIIEDDQ